MEKVQAWSVRVYLRLRDLGGGLAAKFKDTKGQGTTEYAILVGVLVVIAIAAINLFKPKLEELWNAIVAGMQAL